MFHTPSLETPWDEALWGIEKNREKSEECWEIFHENSKTGRLDYSISNEEVLHRTNQLAESLCYENAIQIPLPAQLCPLENSLESVLCKRRNATKMKPTPLTYQQIATILHCSYGITRENANTAYPRSFRATPSAGALYPLEIYFYSSVHNELEPGFYHYNPRQNLISLLKAGDFVQDISQKIVYPTSCLESSLVLFISGLFHRSTFKYNNRGYRFALIEAGHLVQNIDLICTALNLGIINLGGYFDREIDLLLGFDGIAQSTVYMATIGGISASS